MADEGGSHNRLLAMLELEDRGDDRFVAVASNPGEGPPRLFGGQVASQSLRAALRTVDPARPPHSLHAYFIRPGIPGVPLELDVERTRDGRSFSTRHVTTSQNGDPIFVLTASFHVPEEGDDWHEPAPLDLPGPDEVAGLDSPFARFSTMNPLEMRPVRSGDTFPVMHPFWVRTRDPLPDDPALHACVLTFMSDMGVVGSARAPKATSMIFGGASLDHAVWFHRPCRPDQWLLFSVDPISNFGARGLARGSFHDENGLLVASIAQEALLRPTKMVPLP
jgi:acyl-CoA thioesterase II